MGLLTRLMEQFKTLSIIGMAKNSGKTTTLNFLIEEAMDEGIVLGLTSTGRDGESMDLVTGTEKPRIFVEVGTIVTVPVKLYELADAGLEILSLTRYTSPLGQLLLCRVAESGYVQISGPMNTRDHQRLVSEMRSLGAQLVLIDGAIDRKSIAAPRISDGIILATGAVLSRSMKKVVEETMHVVELYSLPVLEDAALRTWLIRREEENRILLGGREGEPKALDLATGLNASRVLDDLLDETVSWIYLPGALTRTVVGDVHPSKLPNVTFLLKDPTRIFLDPMTWQQLKRKGFRVRVLANIQVAAITVNPVAPTGYSFDHEELLAAMQKAAGNIPVIDVRMGGLA